ncbi:hypothetical protein FE257_003669 [Aspergillus nanangensis]|uniref:Uncharacterized protein n=1 Tax=Aspergillus nanangensis TaxID=2582783 RepID=A0AAD4GW95_ASPNN|nr:hypothetical protein FE257_003669 [Aspergillus nanangensis]
MYECILGLLDGFSSGNAPATNNHVDVAHLFIDSGLDPKAFDEYGWTPLTLACGRGYTAMVRLLLQANVDIHKPTRHGDLLVLLAIKLDQAEVVESLIQEDKLKWRDAAGNHTFFTALEWRRKDIAALLNPCNHPERLSVSASQACPLPPWVRTMSRRRGYSGTDSRLFWERTRPEYEAKKSGLS